MYYLFARSLNFYSYDFHFLESFDTFGEACQWVRAHKSNPKDDLTYVIMREMDFLS